MINLTSTPATPDQIATGLVDLPPQHRERLVELLTVDDDQSLSARANDIALLAVFNDLGDDDDPFFRQALIAGNPALTAELERALADQGMEAVHAATVT